MYKCLCLLDKENEIDGQLLAQGCKQFQASNRWLHKGIQKSLQKRIRASISRSFGDEEAQTKLMTVQKPGEVESSKRLHSKSISSINITFTTHCQEKKKRAQRVRKISFTYCNPVSIVHTECEPVQHSILKRQKVLHKLDEVRTVNTKLKTDDMSQRVDESAVIFRGEDATQSNILNMTRKLVYDDISTETKSTEGATIQYSQRGKELRSRLPSTNFKVLSRNGCLVRFVEGQTGAIYGLIRSDLPLQSVAHSMLLRVYSSVPRQNDYLSVVEYVEKSLVSRIKDGSINAQNMLREISKIGNSLIQLSNSGYSIAPEHLIASVYYFRDEVRLLPEHLICGQSQDRESCLQTVIEQLLRAMDRIQSETPANSKN